MGAKIGDPEAIRAFTQMLAAWIGESRGGLQALRARLGEMESSMTWADENHAHYSEEFEQVMSSILHLFAELEDGQVQRLFQLASEYDDVHY